MSGFAFGSRSGLWLVFSVGIRLRRFSWIRIVIATTSHSSYTRQMCGGSTCHRGEVRGMNAEWAHQHLHRGRDAIIKR